MNENTVYYIWLQQALGFGNPKLRTIMKFYNGAKSFYEEDLQSKRMLGCFTNRELERLSDTSLEQSYNIIDQCRTLNYNILTFEDEQYPSCLKEIYNPPAVLYVRGNLPDFDSTLAIAIVGTRTASRQGVTTAFSFASSLSQHGVVVVSGGALGIDCAAHRGVLQSGGTTVCVLGCGINYDYLAENAHMRNLIVNDGALVSEYPPNTPPLARHFPMRNRIISGLSSGVIVVEAGQKSGSLITADLALEQGRDVFAVPGDITSSTQSGTNELIKQGAKFTTSVQDVLEEYEGRYFPALENTECSKDFEQAIESVPVVLKNGKKNTGKTRRTRTNNSKKTEEKNKSSKERDNITLPEDISDDAKKVFFALSEIPIHTDELALKTELSVSRLLTALTELELYGAVVKHSGRRFSK